jgi:hypothetical protein
VVGPHRWPGQMLEFNGPENKMAKYFFERKIFKDTFLLSSEIKPMGIW